MTFFEIRNTKNLDARECYQEGGNAKFQEANSIGNT